MMILAGFEIEGLSMFEDATALLIEMIISEPGISDNDTVFSGLATNGSVVGTTAGLMSIISNWSSFVQILGALEAPAAQALAAFTVGQIAGLQQAGQLGAGAFAESTFIQGNANAATNEAAQTSANSQYLQSLDPALVALTGAVIVVSIGLVLALIGTSQETPVSQSIQYQEYSELYQAIQDLAYWDLSNYWTSKWARIGGYWNPEDGDGLESYFENLAAWGTGGYQVSQDVANWTDAALGFLNEVTSGLNWESYWEVPTTDAGGVPQGFDSLWWTRWSWYGNFPQRIDTAGGAFDPTTMLPILSLALQCFLALGSLENLVDDREPPLNAFLGAYRKFFNSPILPIDPSQAPFGAAGYLSRLYSLYWFAVNGIVKTDLPSQDEILGALCSMAQDAGVFAVPDTDPSQPPYQSWGSPPLGVSPVTVLFSGDGYCWNGLYGAAATYPPYGYYGLAETPSYKTGEWPPYGYTGLAENTGGPGTPSLFSPAYIISMPDTTNAIAQWWREKVIYYSSGGQTYVSMDSLYNWVIPWLENKIILGRMARWKALYLLNSFDQIWAVLQAIQQIMMPDPPIVPPMLTVQDQDGTAYIANGNWSARELIGVVRVSDQLLLGNTNVMNPQQPFGWQPAAYPPVTPAVSGYSTLGLAAVLYNVANGDWGGPPPWAEGEVLPGCLSLRGLLAAIAT